MVLLIRHAAVLILLAATGLPAAEPSPHAIDIPPWFASSFLDFREEVRDAARQDKRVMVYFGQDGCPYCKRLMEVNFSRGDIVAATQRRFVAIALNLWGDREALWMDGATRTEKELAVFLRVQFTPTLLFLDEEGRVALRLNGYEPPERFGRALEYAGQARPGGESFADFLRANTPAEPRVPAASAGLLREPPVSVTFPRKSPQLLIFESRDCLACDELHAALAHPESSAALAALEPVRVDAFGTRSIRHAFGDAATESALARRLGVSFTPTLVFFDADGREVFRAEGYLRRFHLAATLDYVVQGAYRTEPSFQRFLQARADRARAAGHPVDLW